MRTLLEVKCISNDCGLRMGTFVYVDEVLSNKKDELYFSINGNVFIYNNIHYNIKGNLNCNSTGVIYALKCSKCDLLYIGETSNQLRLRLNQHRSNARLATSSHLFVSKHLNKCNLTNLKGAMFTAMPLMEVSRNLTTIRRYWEEVIIKQFNPALNAEPS